MSTHREIAAAIRDYYEMLDQKSSEEVEQLISHVLHSESSVNEHEQFPTPPFYCQMKTYND